MLISISESIVCPVPRKSFKGPVLIRIEEREKTGLSVGLPIYAGSGNTSYTYFSVFVNQVRIPSFLMFNGKWSLLLNTSGNAYSVSWGSCRNKLLRLTQCSERHQVEKLQLAKSFLGAEKSHLVGIMSWLITVYSVFEPIFQL